MGAGARGEGEREEGDESEEEDDEELTGTSTPEGPKGSLTSHSDPGKVSVEYLTLDMALQYPGPYDTKSSSPADTALKQARRAEHVLAQGTNLTLALAFLRAALT